MIDSFLNAVGVPALLVRRNRAHIVNDAACDLLQQGRDQIIGRDLFGLIHPSSRASVWQLYRDATETAAGAQAILRLSTRAAPRDARWLRVHLKSANFVGAGWWVATLLEVTAHLVSEEDMERQMAYHLPVGLYRASMDGAILYSNPAHARLLGYDTPAEVIEHARPAEIISDAQIAAIAQQVRANPNQVIEDEFQIRRQDGTIIWVQHALRMVTTGDDAPPYVEGTVRDITAEKEHALRLQQRNRELETMNAIVTTLAQNLDLDECLDRLLVHIGDVIPYTSATVSLVDQGTMHFVATRGLPDPLRAILDHILEERHNSSNYGYRVMHEKRPVILGDTHEDPLWIQRPETAYIRAWMGVPLLYQDKVIGVFTLDHETPNTYTEEHVAQAQAIANQAAIAISNARLYEQAQSEIAERERTEMYLIENLQRMDALYQVMHMLITAEDMKADLPHILKTVQRVLNTESLWLITFDLEAHVLQYQVAAGEVAVDPADDFCTILRLDTFQMPAAHLDYPTGLVSALPQDRQALSAVVMKRGLLTVVRGNEGLPFNVGERELLVGIANQLSMTLDNHSLYDRLRQQAQLLEQRVVESTQELRLERQRLEAILDATAEGIIYMEDFVIQYSNPAFTHMLGYEEGELIGTALAEIRQQRPATSRPEFDFAAWDDPLMGTSWNDDLLMRKDGEIIHTNMIFNLIGEPGEKVVRMVAVVRDMTPERRLHYQRMNFVKNAAHELRTPLTSFGLRLHMLRRQPDRVDAHLPTLERVHEYLRSVVEELLDLTRFEQGSIVLSKERYMLQSIVEQAIHRQNDYAQEREVEVLMDMPEEPLWAYVDTSRFLQLTGNLVINALNYVANAGHVLVRLREMHQGELRYIELQVEDDGPPIEPELLPRQIFSPFARPGLGTQRETGMGLAIAREIVLLHNGQIRVDTSEGGSVFTVVLPADG